ncbi:hypothetical protein M404DRAFT_996311 [Pisolithus tinctorius Marx 270]|uniref:Uncharacterized protein n=1 Tax=Pisolithus tinctorius Marx 270 TaxID=870435 RepID=A0A0C3KIQ2_PISTI|nr:hypothetical protein M404DRAFT_996311 [Pisolithus tinctorius Marx 270]
MGRANPGIRFFSAETKGANTRALSLGGWARDWWLARVREANTLIHTLHTHRTTLARYR